MNPARARVRDFLAGGPVSGSAPTLSAQLAADIAALWADPALGKAYDRRSEFQVQHILRAGQNDDFRPLTYTLGGGGGGMGCIEKYVKS